MPVNPVVFLAFSHDPTDDLPGVRQELQTVMSVFDHTTFFPDHRWQARQDEIENAFEKYADKLRIFHFSGHADPAMLQVNNNLYTPVTIFSEALSRNLGLFCRQMKLVFLNGCSTKAQAEFFLDNGVPAVIATSRPVIDTVACAFAERFYKKFTSEGASLSLQAAFNATLNSIDTDFGKLRLAGSKLNTNLLAQKARGSFRLKKGDHEPLYTLYINHKMPGIAMETFRDWGGTPASSGNITIVGDPLQMKSGGVDKECYLLCDRVQQYPEFEKVLQKKLSGAAPDPFFFFVHAEEEHCPDDLPERFNRYGLPAFCQQKSFSEEIVLSEPDVFRGGNPDDPVNPTRDLYKIRLSEIYKEHFEGEPARTNHLCKLFRRPGDEDVLVVLHRFSPEEWSDYYDPAASEALHVKVETLLRYYIGDFSAYLRNGFSERLIVIFSVQYYEPDAFFPDLFQRLEQDFTANRVKVLGNLPPIRKSDVGRWQDETLKEQFFLVKDVFLDRKGTPAESIPFFDAKKILIHLIEQFNRAKAADVKT